MHTTKYTEDMHMLPEKILKTIIVVNMALITGMSALFAYMNYPDTGVVAFDTFEAEDQEYIEALENGTTNSIVNSPRSNNPTSSDFVKLNKYIEDVENRVGSEEGDFGVYFKNLKTGYSLELGEDRIYPPASTFKVYTATIILREIQEGRLSFDNCVLFGPGLISPGPGTYFTEDDYGKCFSIRYLLSQMIVQSDNTAQSMLFARLGRANIEEKLVSDLSLENTSLENFETTTIDMASVVEGVYRNELLEKEYADHLLNLMRRSFARDRIRAGLPYGTEVANKGGTLETSKHDVAIIFKEEGDYVLIVYSDDIIEANAVNTIKDISKITWEYMGPESE